jgi:hypothetical protein
MCASKTGREDVLQVKCLINDEGHVWISSYDRLPATVRKRLRDGPFNLCAACLECFVMPKVRKKYPTHSREQQLLIGIAAMEIEVRKDAVKAERGSCKAAVGASFPLGRYRRLQSRLGARGR